MGPLIPIAIGIATKYLPGLVGKAFDSKTAEDVANTVIETAKVAVGAMPGASKETLLKEYEELLAKDRAQQQQLSEAIAGVLKLEVDDIKDARDHFSQDKATDRLTYVVMIGNLPLVATLVAAIIYISSMQLAEGVLTAISTVIGTVIGALLQERQQVMNYRFGSSIGEKYKKLTGK